MSTAPRWTLFIVLWSVTQSIDRSGQAASYYWNGPSSGNWSAASNWGGVEPTSNDIAYVTNGGTVTITELGEVAWILKFGGGSVVNQLGGSLSAEALYDERGSFTYNLSGGLLTAITPYYSGRINQSGGRLEGPGVGLWIGGGRGPADYTFTDGTLEATGISVGATAGGAGTMSMSSDAGGNPVATVTHSNGMVVGGGSFGTLNMSGGTIDVRMGPVTIGSSSSGIVNQTGGLINCTGLYFGRSFNGFASYTYNLDGGTLALSFMKVGPYANPAKATFNFGGGTLQANGNFATAQSMTLTGIGGNANLDTAGSPVTLSGQLSGLGGLNKLGSNTLVLSAINTYSGPTTVAAGTLQIDGSLAPVSTVTVKSGATLSGNGVAGQVFVSSGGQLAPGVGHGSAGSLTFHGDLTLDSGAVLQFDLGAPSNSDGIGMPSSTLFLHGLGFSDFIFSPQTGFRPGTYTLIDANLIEGSLGTDVTGMIGNHHANVSVSGNDLVLTVLVPEPSTFATAIAAASVITYSISRRFRSDWPASATPAC